MLQGCMLLIAPALAALLLGCSGDDRPSAISDLGGGPRGESTLQPASPVPTPNEERVHQARLAASTARAAAEQALRLAGELRAEEQLWEEKVEPLRTNDVGQKIASQPEQLRNFRALIAIEKVPPEDLEALETRVREHQAFIETFLKKPGTDPTTQTFSTAVTAGIDKERREVEGWLKRYRSARERIELLVADVQNAPSGGPGPEDAETYRREVADLKTQISNPTTVPQEELKERVAALNSRQLQVLATDQDVKDWYQPFLAKGLYDGKYITNPRRIEEQGGYSRYKDAMSFKALQQAGALSGDRKGWEVFWKIAHGVQGYYNDRPRWTESQSRADDDRKRVLYPLFIRLAPLWRDSEELAK